MIGGVDVCLSCFNGGCTRKDKHHAEAHATKAKHPLTLNVKRLLKETESPRPTKLTKLEIKEESEEDLYTFEISVRCWECQIEDINRNIGQVRIKASLLSRYRAHWLQI